MEYQKYQIGEIVRVKINANKIDDRYIGWTDLMDELLGKEFVVKGYYKYTNDAGYYKLEGACHAGVNGDGYWQFSERWLEPAGEEILIDENDFENIFA